MSIFKRLFRKKVSPCCGAPITYDAGHGYNKDECSKCGKVLVRYIP